MGSALGVKVMDSFRRTTGLELNKIAKRTMRRDHRTSGSVPGLFPSFNEYILNTSLMPSAILSLQGTTGKR